MQESINILNKELQKNKEQKTEMNNTIIEIKNILEGSIAEYLRQNG